MVTGIRERSEQNEHLILSPKAAFADASKGRPREEDPCPIRTVFQRDTDRIIHSNAFSRLKQKTQVFLAPQGDHYTTRLTHTIQVSQIARVMARALMLNENLTEAVAMGHDVGHTPFGHAGEMALNEMLPDGFRHYEHSARVLQCLEKGGRGLNLCAEVVDGIVCHTSGKWADCLEGRLVRLADRIAYVNHDIDDAVRAGIIAREEVPHRKLLGETRGQRITSLVNGVIEYADQTDCTSVGPEYEAAFEELHTFMYQNVYLNPAAKKEEQKAIEVVRTLYEFFLKNPERMPPEHRETADHAGRERAVADYIAGMTDRYAICTYEELFVPRGWQIS